MVTQMRTLMILLLTVAACAPGASMGGSYVGQGAHPHVAWTAEVRSGPAQLTHSATGAGPVLDETALTVAPPVRLGPMQLAPQLGIHASRQWISGSCGPTGYTCHHRWHTGGVFGAGAIYRHGAGRFDLRYLNMNGQPGKDWRIIALVGVDF